jgi:DNA polymerase
MAKEYDALDLFEPPVAVVSSMLRSMMRAAPGKTLMAGDYASIEAVVLNWLAGQEDVLENFRQYFAGDKSRDPYVVMASKMKNCSLAEAKEKYRQPGKAAELGCGFQMGWKKFISAAWQVYQVRVDESEARTAVKIYRESHPMVVALWNDANEAALNAVANPGIVYEFGGLNNLRFVFKGKYLWLQLPSKRFLAYPAARIEDTQRPWGEMGPSVTYSAIDGKTHQWLRHTLYGGLIIENVVQATSRDLLAEAMVRLEETGRYPIVLHAHDEAVAETDPNETSVEEMEAIMSILPGWAAGLPVKVEGWQSERYRK